jgi:hypothetical protein
MLVLSSPPLHFLLLTSYNSATLVLPGVTKGSKDKPRACSLNFTAGPACSQGSSWLCPFPEGVYVLALSSILFLDCNFPVLTTL